MSAAEPLYASLDEFAELAGVTPETMRGYLKDVGRDGNVPAWLAERGDRGRAYKIEAEGALAWWRKLQDDQADAEASRRDRLAQLRLELVGEAGGDEQALALSGRQRKEEVEAGMALLKYRRAIEQLVERRDVERVISAASVEHRRQLQRIPAEFGIAHGLSPDQVRDLDGRIERAIATFVQAITKPGAFEE